MANNRLIPVTAKMSAEEIAKLKAYAESNYRTISAEIRRLVVTGLKQDER